MKTTGAWAIADDVAQAVLHHQLYAVESITLAKLFSPFLSTRYIHEFVHYHSDLRSVTLKHQSTSQSSVESGANVTELSLDVRFCHCGCSFICRYFLRLICRMI